LSGDTITQGATTLLKTLGSNNATQDTEVADTIGGFIALCSEDYAGAIKDLFGILGALGGGGPDEAFTLAQQTDKMITSVYTSLSADLKQVQGQIAQVQATLNNMYAAMLNGFSDVLFATGQVTSQLVTAEYTLGQLQYQVDLTDGDLVAFGLGQIQTQIQTTIDTCLGLAARNLAPLNFPGFSNCEGQFVAELTDASNGLEEYTTAPPPAPSGGNYGSDGTVAATLQAHGMDPAAELSYVLSILNGWYGLGSNPAALPVALVNPGVWSEVALAYRELLDEYPQFSAGTEPDLTRVEQPGEQVAQLISALQQDNTSSWTNPAIDNIAGNYSGTLAQVVNDVNARENAFPSTSTSEYLTPTGGPWDGYNPFNGPEQANPSNNEVHQPAVITSMPACGTGANPLSVSDSPAWQTSVNIPNSWYLLFNLVGYANAAIKGTTMPLCYNFSSTKPTLVCHVVKNIPVCNYEATMSGSLAVQFAGTDWATHTMETITTPTEVNYTCTASTCFTAGNYFSGLISKDGSLAALLADSGGKTVTPDTSLLDSEGNQILAAEQKQAYQWAVSGFDGTSDAALTADMSNLTGAFELLQLTAQILAPSASLGNQAISDILYGQDQLPTTATGPNNPVAALQALAGGSGANPLGQWSNLQSSRLTLVQNLLDSYLGSAQQAATASSVAMAPRKASTPPAVGDLATAEAPDLTYSTLAQLATGAALDTDAVTVKNPGGQTSTVNRAASLHVSAASSAEAPITSWSAAGLPPGLSINPASGLISGTPTTAGSFNVTVTATDTVGNSEHNTGHATFTWNVVKLVACGSQLVSNGGFESGLTPWRSSTGVRIASTKALPAYAGKWLGRLGGRTSPRTDYLSQSVTIQASCATATLSFYQRIITNDPATKAYDTLAVRILTPGGKVLKTLAAYSNRNASANYRLYQFSLKAFIGQTIVIRFSSAETLKSHATSFLIDNVALRSA
jgi:hypothetical protein